MAEDHVGNLRKARDELVTQRRLNISALKGDYGQNTERQLTALIKYEQAFKAIDRATVSEGTVSAKFKLAASTISSRLCVVV